MCVTAGRKSPEKSSGQWDKTKEIEAVRFNKRARRKEKKEGDGETGCKLKLAVHLVVFFNFRGFFSFSLSLFFH